MSVCGTGRLRSTLSGFSRRGARTTSTPSSGARRPSRSVCGTRICLGALRRGPTGPVHAVAGWPRASRPRLAPGCGCRTIHLLAIAYAGWHQPRLRTRLTLGRLPLPRNPQAFGVRRSQPHSRYSFRHSRFGSLHRCSRSGFSATPERSPTACGPRCAPHTRGFGGLLKPRYVVGAASLDQ